MHRKVLNWLFEMQDYLWGTAVAIKNVLGNGELIILVVALTMGIFSGLNDFIISSSRLLLSCAKVIPIVLSKLHPKYKTPYVGIIFSVVLAMLAIWFGRQTLM